MLATLFALRDVSSWGVADFLIAVVIVAACVGIAMAAIRYFGVVIPQVVVYIFWICLIAFLAILAIRFVASL